MIWCKSIPSLPRTATHGLVPKLTSVLLQDAQEPHADAVTAALEDAKWKGGLNIMLGTSCPQGSANNFLHHDK